MKRKTFVIFVFFIVMCLSTKAHSWIPFSPNLGEQAPCIETIESDNEHHRFRVRIPGVYKTLLVNSETTYASLEFKDYCTLTNIGEPALPVITQMIGLPASCIGYDITLMDSTWTKIELKKIYPYQTPLLEAEKSTSFDFVTSAYETTPYIANIIETSNIMYYKGMRNITYYYRQQCYIC